MISIIVLIAFILFLYINIDKFTESYHDKCFKEFKKSHPEIKDKCGGATGGDRHTNYLSYSCIDCPYLNKDVFTVRKEK